MSNKTKSKKPWPTRDAMAQIYEMNLWGGGEADFYSGSGSHDPEIVEPYVQAVNDFLRSFSEPLVVLDLGCGDFNIGNQLLSFAGKYFAVDIVEKLIERNKAQYQAEHLEFLCLDIAEDEWPDADVVILRQVLQHLSNAEIHFITEKLRKYPFIILTEHLPDEDFEPNKDIISGQGTRLKRGSGVDLKAPPFKLSITREKQLLKQKSGKWGGILRTTIYQI